MSTYNADSPIEDPARDLFGRWPFARRVAETIARRETGDALVVGLYGRWGSGKTTVLNFVRAALAPYAPNVVHVTFNPWLFSSTEQLLTEFFGLIAKTLDRTLETSLEKLGGILQKMGSATSGVSFAAGAASASGAIVGGVGNLLGGIQIEEMKDRVGKALREEGKRIVVLIDDIDRLDVEETYLLFRVIKLVADFSNTTYVLAFDDEVVGAALGRRYPEQQRFGEGFVEKIVQVPLHLPNPRLDLVHRVVFEGIDRTLAGESISLPVEDVVRFRTAFDMIGGDIDTPRSAVRYLNAVRFSLPMLRNEVDVVDLLILEGLRATSPRVYLWVSAHKRLLAQPSMTAETNDEVAAELDAMLETVESSRRTQMNRLLSEVFPRARRAWNVFGMGSGSDEALAKSRRVASRPYFDRYFQYVIGTDDVADAEISELLQLANASDGTLPERLHALLDGVNAGIGMTKIRQLSETLSVDGLRSMLMAMGAVGEALDFDEAGVFTLSTGEQAGLLVRDLLQRLPSDEDRANVAEALISAAEPLEYAVEIFRWIGSPDTEEPLVEEARRQRLKEILGQRVVEANEEEPLFNSKPLWAARLYRLAVESPAGPRVREQLRSQISDGRFAAAFVRTFMTRATTVDTGQKSVYLDSDAVNAATGVVDLNLLRPSLESIAATVDSSSVRMRDDMSQAPDDEVAARFLLLADTQANGH